MTDPLSPGRLLGERYLLGNVVAHGGMAQVWVADDTILARRVAIKVLHDNLVADDAVRERFRREALAAARVVHPNIVSIFDTGEDAGTVYIVMEYVDGETLRRLIDTEGRLRVDRTLAITSQIADALEFAHSRGLVHRDVKPANVLLDEHARVKVADFGIAKAIGADGDLTRTGTIVGTARYLAPEQVTGGLTDARTDVYALALVVYEMLTGAPAFGGDTDLGSAISRLTTDPPSLRSRRPELDASLVRAVERGLEREPDERWGTVAQFRDALTGTRTPKSGNSPPQTPVEGSRRRVAWRAVAALVAGLAILVTTFVLWRSDRSPAPIEPIAIVGATDFDPPPGDGTERGETAGGAIDGDPTTGWTTETYATPDLGGRKAGVGLRLDLAEPSDVGSVVVDTDAEGWSADIFVADAPGATLETWGPVQASGTDLGTTARFDLASSASGAAVLVWITHLPDGGRLVVNGVQVGR